MLVLAIGCSTGTKIISIKTSTIVFSPTATPDIDQATVDLIAPYKLKLERDMSGVLATNENDMFKDTPEGVLGNFVADLVLKKTNDYAKDVKILPANLCLLNNGGLRTTLPKGEITKRRVFELMPFENELVILTLSGEKTQGLFDYLARLNGMPLAGARMEIKDRKAKNITIDGEPFDPTREYRIATSDYLAYGGDKMKFFKDPLKFETVGHKLRDAIIEYMIEETEKGNTLNPVLDGRIKTLD